MTRLFLLSMLSTLVIVVFANAADQGYESRNSLDDIPVGFLKRKDVIKELELVGYQAKAWDKAITKLETEARELFDSLVGLPQEEQVEKFKEVSKEVKDRQFDLIDELENILLPHQRERLVQLQFRLRIQQLGITRAFSSPEVTEALGISQQQLEQLVELRIELNHELRSKLADFEREATKKMVDVLTGEQKKRWEKLAGAPLGGDRGGSN